MTPFTPNNVQPLAKGQNGGQGGADLIYYYHPAGGGVLAGSSITFTGALAQDPSLTKLVLNFISHFNN